jgi:hypothetical protein
MPRGRSPTGSCAVPKERAPGRHSDALIKATAPPRWSHELQRTTQSRYMWVVCSSRVTGNSEVISRPLDLYQSTRLSSVVRLMTRSRRPGTDLLDEWIGDSALIKNAPTSKLAAVTCLRRRFYGNLPVSATRTTGGV